MPLDRREITAGRAKSPFVPIAFALAICVLAISTNDGPHTETWLLMAGLVLAAAFVTFVNTKPPARFVLDEEGFGYAGHPHMARWEEVVSFGVMDLPRGRYMNQMKVVTIQFQPGVEKCGPTVTKINNLVGKGDGSIVFVWPRPHEVIADELNGYRREALEAKLLNQKR
jgi:hypothetical protein